VTELDLKRDGVTILRGGVLPAQINGLVSLTAWLYGEIERGLGDAPSPRRRNLTQTHGVWRGFRIEDVRDFLSIDEQARYLYAVLIDEVAADIRRQIGTTLEFSPKFSFFRRAVVGAPSSVNWHCDAEAAGTLERGGDGLSVWVPLEPVGRDLPSLEFILGSQAKMGLEAQLVGAHRPDDWVDKMFGDRWVPMIDNPGDAVVFDQFVLHRTQQMAADAPRTSCEFRFMP